MDSPILKHSIVLRGSKTSISLEELFWKALKEDASVKNISISTLICRIDEGRGRINLSSSIRQYLFRNYCNIVLEIRQKNSDQRAMPDDMITDRFFAQPASNGV